MDRSAASSVEAETMTTLEIGPGTLFGGDFRVVRPLRVGGMGAVYVAEQLSTSTLRALKVMQGELVADPGLRERFEQEARVGARIESDHVVQVVGAGVDPVLGLPWLAMELLKGLPLDLYLQQRGALPPGEVRFLFEQLCHALGAAHDQGIVHRDLKPANVFLATPRLVGLSYVVKVLDFGIAKVLAESKNTKTAAVGTPLYMAPEQYEAGKVQPSTDVWALGLIAFELLTGRSYWKAARDGNATPASIMYETCLGELAPPSSRVADLGLRAALPDGFDAWFSRCLQRQPDLRVLDARMAFESLAAVLGPAEPPRESLPTPREPAHTPATMAMTPSPRSSETASGTAIGTAMGTAIGTAIGTELAPSYPTTPAARAQIVDVRAAHAPPRTEPSKPRVSPGLLGAVAGLALLAIGAVALHASTGASGSATEPASKSAAHPPPHPPSTASAKPHVDHVDPTQFSAGETLAVEGRLLHKQVLAGAKTETYVMLDLRGADEAPKAVLPVHLSLAIDRSGSMKGGRLQNAIAAAVKAIEGLRDGDEVSVVAFDQAATTLVPRTVLDASSRASTIAAVQKLGLGGNTCISCGIATSLTALGGPGDFARRILLLSDGEANVGVRDVAGFEGLGRSAQKADVAITTIGVGQDFDSKSLAALSRESNGQHYYAATEAALPGIFDAQAKAMTSVVAMGAEAIVRLAPGVELRSVLDRAHSIEKTSDGRVVVRVPLGQFTRGERKTVLLKVALKANDDVAEVADVDVAFRAVGAGATKATGTLAVPVGLESSELDPVVETRVKRSETAAALIKATELFEQGKAKEASAILTAQQKALAAQKTKWSAGAGKAAGPAATAAPKPALMADVDAQQKALEDANKAYGAAAEAPAAAAPGKPAPMAPAAKAASKKAAADAWEAGY